MSKKKRKRHRRPVAPPVHSAPGTVHGPSGPPAGDIAPSRPFTPEPPAVGQPLDESQPAVASTPVRPREAARRKPAKRRRRRGSTRTYLIVAGIILAIVAVVVGRQAFNNRRVANLNELARAAGCQELQTTETSGAQQHLAEGQTTTYDSSPPTHGRHAPNALPDGIYDEPFTNVLGERSTIYQAVHSLEHGYVIIWHDGLSEDRQRTLERRYRDERKVIVVPYPQLSGDTHMALTAWGRKMTCERAGTGVIDAFVDLLREARSAPEPRGP
ncbi:MAG: DUF3105 domain-containing protein [Actinomycetota bacterium]